MSLAPHCRQLANEIGARPDVAVAEDEEVLFADFEAMKQVGHFAVVAGSERVFGICHVG